MSKVSSSASHHYHAIRSHRRSSTFKQGDVLVLFGELFNRGYANGLVEEAERRGMTIVRSTVGRREKDLLRALTPEEAAAHPKPFLNVPLEAGFDFEPASHGLTPFDQIKDVRMSEWEQAKVDFDAISESQRVGHQRFVNNVRAWTAQLSQLVPDGANVVFAHLMAGGVPRAKIVMPLMNRTFKGVGDRHLPSKKFWDSDIGKLCARSFVEVTANTFDVLVTETTELRERLERQGRKVSYLAYGYHGTEVLINENYLWQTYTPYLQGWAKMALESHLHTWQGRGVVCSVYNCPEILTNSSSIFQGVEVSLYPLIGALMKESSGSRPVQKLLADCQALLKPEHSLAEIIQFTNHYLTRSTIREHCDFAHWPQHSSQPQMELMLGSSDQLIRMHRDPKQLLTAVLSEVVFGACGRIMMSDIAHPESAVSWLNHDVLARVMNEE